MFDAYHMKFILIRHDTYCDISDIHMHILIHSLIHIVNIHVQRTRAYTHVLCISYACACVESVYSVCMCVFARACVKGNGSCNDWGGKGIWLASC